MLQHLQKKFKNCWERIKKQFKRSGKSKPCSPPLPESIESEPTELIFYEPEPIMFNPVDVDPHSLAEYFELTHIPTQFRQIKEKIWLKKAQRTPKKLTMTSGSEASSETSKGEEVKGNRFLKEDLPVYKPYEYEHITHYLHFLDSDSDDFDVIEEYFVAEDEE